MPFGLSRRERAAPNTRQHSFQVLAGVALRGRGNGFGRARGDDLAASVAALGTQVDHPVRGFDHIQVVLDHHDRVARHTTDNLANVSHAVSKDELQAGDALNLTTGRDPEGDGHVRMFDRWANAQHTKMYVYEETPPKSLHHVIDWDPKYQPMRRNNVIDA